jgi:hypothetical protein
MRVVNVVEILCDYEYTRSHASDRQLQGVRWSESLEPVCDFIWDDNLAALFQPVHCEHGGQRILGFYDQTIPPYKNGFHSDTVHYSSSMIQRSPGLA